MAIPFLPQSHLVELSLQVNLKMVENFEKEGLVFVGQDVEGKRMEMVELAGKALPPGHINSHCNPSISSDHPYFVGVQYHPEYLTRPMVPSPPYLGLILSSIGKLQVSEAGGVPDLVCSTKSLLHS